MYGCSVTEVLLEKPQLWSAPLENGDLAVVIVNWMDVDTTDVFEFNYGDAGLAPGPHQTVHVTDLHSGESLGNLTGDELVQLDSIPANGCRAFRASIVSTPKA
jgi:hypothetical protein